MNIVDRRVYSMMPASVYDDSANLSMDDAVTDFENGKTRLNVDHVSILIIL